MKFFRTLDPGQPRDYNNPVEPSLLYIDFEAVLGDPGTPQIWTLSTTQDTVVVADLTTDGSIDAQESAVRAALVVHDNESPQDREDRLNDVQTQNVWNTPLNKTIRDMIYDVQVQADPAKFANKNEYTQFWLDHYKAML